MATARIPDPQGAHALRQLRGAHERGEKPLRIDEATAVRWLLQRLAATAPGNAVEVRVPPFGAIQCVEGPGHTRGTPPNVVELDAETWVALATGETKWADAVASGQVHASGVRADLSGLLPLPTPDPARHEPTATSDTMGE